MNTVPLICFVFAVILSVGATALKSEVTWLAAIFWMLTSHVLNQADK